MRLLGWLAARDSHAPSPRSYEEIKETVDRRDAPHVQRMTRVEDSLLSLTAEAGLEDLRRRMESIRD